MSEAGVIERLALQLARLPGIGPRTAERLTHYIIRLSPRAGRFSLARELAAALVEVADEVRLCERCRNLATDVRCQLCTDGRRIVTSLCVVESIGDLQALERTEAFAGSYFVLHGTLAPLEGIGPEDLGLAQLLARIEAERVTEVILACNATLEGDTTALYLARELHAKGITITRLASGVPQGGELSYLDGATLGRALRERRSFAATA